MFFNVTLDKSTINKLTNFLRGGAGTYSRIDSKYDTNVFVTHSFNSFSVNPRLGL